MKSLLRELQTMSFSNQKQNKLIMKKFGYDDFKSNKLFALILENFYSEIHNFGHFHYGENFTEKGFNNTINLILNQFFLMKQDKISVIEFKNNFLEKKNKSNSGTITINSKDKEHITYVNYEGDFVYYSIIIYHLIHRCFCRELGNKDIYFERIVSLITDNYHELNRNPINYDLIQKVTNVFKDSGFSHEDMADYIDLFLQELESQYTFETDVTDISFPIMEQEELTTLGLKIMFMIELGVLDFLKNKYELENNNFKLSKVIHSFTGLDAKKINSIIHPIFNDFTNQKNNPYKNKKNLPKIKGLMQQLMLNE